MPTDAKRPRSPSIPLAPSKRPFSLTPAAVADAADDSSLAPLGNGDALISNSRSPPNTMKVEQSPSKVPFSDSKDKDPKDKDSKDKDLKDKDDASIPRRPASVDEPKINISIRAIISTQDASIVIGKGGDHIKEIRLMSGARVTVSPSSPNTLERILTVSGALDAVSKAFGLVVRRINDEPLEQPSVPGSRAYTLRLAVPNAWMGSVIGKGGSKIKEMQEASGARIRAEEQMLPNSNERALVVIGVADAVHIAVYYIGNVLHEHGDRGPVHQPYHPMNLAAQHPVMYSGIGQPRGQMGRGGYQSAPAVGSAGTVTHQMHIPNDLVGTIIGKGGQKINEIRRLSGCYIKISEPGQGGTSNENERLVTITGLPHNVNNARQMLYNAEERAKMNNPQRLDSDGTNPSGYQMGEG